MRRIDIKTGDRFNRLTIIEEKEQLNKRRRFLCKCDCGNYIIIQISKTILTI